MKYSKSGSKHLNDAGNNIFIKNLHHSIDNQALHAIFGKYGTILSVKIATNEQNESLGYGYVSYKDKESAISAVSKVCNL